MTPDHTFRRVVFGVVDDMAWPYRHVAGLPPRQTKKARFLYNDEDAALEWRSLPTDPPLVVDVLTLGLGVDNTGTDDCGTILNDVTFVKGTTIFFPEGTYLFSTTWNISQDNITVKGVGSREDLGPATIFKSGDTTYQVRSIAETKAVEFHDIRFEGVEADGDSTGSLPSGAHILYRISGDATHSFDGAIKRCYFLYGRSAFSVFIPNHFLVEDCVIDANETTGANFYSPKNLTVRRCWFKNSGHNNTTGLNEDALKITTGTANGDITSVVDNVVVDQCLFEDSAQDGLDIHTYHARNIKVINNHFRNNAKAMDIKPAPDDNETNPIEENGLRGWHDILVAGNTIYDSGDINLNNLLEDEPEGRTLRGLNISNNTIQGGSISLTGTFTTNEPIARNSVISNNVINDGGLLIRYFRDSLVSGNTIYNSNSSGFVIQSISNERVTFINNVMTGADVDISTSTVDCAFVSNMLDGADFNVFTAERCQFVGNFVKGALLCTTSVTDTAFIGNYVYNSGDEGLDMSTGAGCVFMSNYFNGNRFGVLTATTDSSTIFAGNYCAAHIGSGGTNGAIRINSSATAGQFFRNVLVAPGTFPLMVNSTTATATFYDNIINRSDTFETYSQAMTGPIVQNVLVEKVTATTPSGFGASVGDIVPAAGNSDVLYWVCTTASSTTPTWKAVLKSADSS